jgi:fructoselysine transporter
MMQPKRELTMPAVLAIIIGTVIGSGVFINLPLVQNAAGSPLLAVIAWAIGGLIWLPQIFILSEMGTAYPQQGFGYLYLEKAGSPFLGFLYVWTVFLTSDTPSITILAFSAVAALDFFFPILHDSIWTKVLAALIIMALTIVHVRSVRQGGRLQMALTILKISPLILLGFLGFFFLKSELLFILPQGENLRPWYMLLAAGVAGTVWSYAGFPNILYMAGEVKNPGKILPKALIGSTVFVTIIYVLVAFATGALVPHAELTAISGFANPFRYIPWFAAIAAGFLAVSAFISMIGATNACIMVQPRIEYAIAKDGRFFKPFGILHPKYGTPANSIMIQSGLAILMLFIGGLDDLLGYFTLSYILQNLLVYASLYWLKKRPDYQPEYQAPWRSVMLFLSILFQALLLGGAFLAYPGPGIAVAAILILTGWPLYHWFNSKNQTKQND